MTHKYPPALRAISKGPALRRETSVVSRPALHGGAVDGGILAISGDETRLFALEQTGVLAALPVLTGACQFGHGAGGLQPRRGIFFVVLTKLFMGEAADFARSR